MLSNRNKDASLRSSILFPIIGSFNMSMKVIKETLKCDTNTVN